jgi:RNA polymerase sigma-70 factor, ECF subfamily
LETDQQSRLQAALTKAVQGDQLAFAEIVREHQGMVFSIAWHFLRNRSLAEELAQDIFLQLYQKLAGIQSPAHLTYWLRRVTAHRCIDQSRRVKPEIGLEQVAEPATEGPEKDPFLDRQLQQSVALLPEKWRMIVILRYQEGLELAEIAELLEIPLNTVKSSLQRSLTELRTRLTRRIGGVRYALF